MNKQCYFKGQNHLIRFGCFFSVLFLLFTNNTTAKSQLYFYQDIPYALCSHALCLDIDDDSKTVQCMCPIITKTSTDDRWRLDSISPVSPDKGKPEYSGSTGQLKTILSTFSLANNQVYSPGKLSDNDFQYVQCTASDKVASEYADCFDIRCDVINETAYCTCPIVSSNQYYLGFTQQKFSKFCRSGAVIWSGVSIDDGEAAKEFILKNYDKHYINDCN